MKKLLFLLIAFGLLFVLQTPTVKAAPEKQGICLIASADVSPAATMQEEGGATAPPAATNVEATAAELEAPNATLTDVVNIPGKDSGWTDWIYWAISALVYVFYNFVVRLIPTSKSWTIGSILYRLGNLIIKDRSATGGILKIRSDY